MYVDKIKKDQVQSSKLIESEYYGYLKELFENYAINQKKHVTATTIKDDNKKHVTATTIKDINKHEQQKLIREALKKGYVEMSQINLTICLECQYAEYEAQHTTERLVSGG